MAPSQSSEVSTVPTKRPPAPRIPPPSPSGIAENAIRHPASSSKPFARSRSRRSQGWPTLAAQLNRGLMSSSVWSARVGRAP
eukprot:scaffold8943_cov103-Isochrysis_galbana.AAC.2